MTTSLMEGDEMYYLHLIGCYVVTVWSAAFPVPDDLWKCVEVEYEKAISGTKDMGSLHQGFLYVMIRKEEPIKVVAFDQWRPMVQMFQSSA